ncbi:uncharacterized protein FOMMEDRAFT_86828 [Fomitiporia mediterranea MF3/22]|uniref:uncharacterized protein n=1 Tax=Fomitiporia mediterranea (strain MF3/22) TaxID=694068 RepID=UPI0004408A90|nr:uncharacterized protein FOMMEDRAFT_86828 [Fomitiporia mediterranea MF3/22]EJD01908.1 hypothetical protein FOMMEDRAFT_86828 [Fomitiporia mediterranea MF3/22]
MEHQILSTSGLQTLAPNDSIDYDEDDSQGGRKKNKNGKRRKVNHACVYCRRSHMTCDDSRPCKRCVKRDIGHLCHDERKPVPGIMQPKPGESEAVIGGPGTNTASGTGNNYGLGTDASTIMPWNMGVPLNSYGFPVDSSATNNEFSFLTEFLENLDEASFFGAPQSQNTGLNNLSVQQQQQQQQQQPTTYPSQQLPLPDTTSSTATSYPSLQNQEPQSTQPTQPVQTEQPQQEDTSPIPIDPSLDQPKPKEDVQPAQPILPSATKKERFLLIAADQGTGSPNERLNRVIQAKYEAGLLKPYNYVKGYARLSKWMDRNVSQDSKQQILQPLSILRPKFRAVAQTLRDMDLVFIEEAFERLLLDYDRVFSAMGVPACLWRRTGEIVKGNREFTELVGVDDYMLRDGRLCIYEVMAEESAVNYWEKYGQVAFDSTQKAVLTSCVLRYKPVFNFPSSGGSTPVSHRKSFSASKNEQKEEGFVSCCFSFTIRRDMVGIPSMIVGNFIKC